LNRWFSVQRGELAESIEVDFWKHTRHGWSPLQALGRELTQAPQFQEARARDGPVLRVRYDSYVRTEDPGALATIEVDFANWREPEQNAQVWMKLRKEKSSRFFSLPPAPTVRVLVLDAEPSMIDSAPFRVTVGGINRDAASLLG